MESQQVIHVAAERSPSSHSWTDPKLSTMSILSINNVKTNLKLYGDSRILITPESLLITFKY